MATLTGTIYSATTHDNSKFSMVVRFPVKPLAIYNSNQEDTVSDKAYVSFPNCIINATPYKVKYNGTLYTAQALVGHPSVGSTLTFST